MLARAAPRGAVSCNALFCGSVTLARIRLFWLRALQGEQLRLQRCQVLTGCVKCWRGIERLAPVRHANPVAVDGRTLVGLNTEDLENGDAY